MQRRDEGNNAGCQEGPAAGGVRALQVVREGRFTIRLSVVEAYTGFDDWLGGGSRGTPPSKR